VNGAASWVDAVQHRGVVRQRPTRLRWTANCVFAAGIFMMLAVGAVFRLVSTRGRGTVLLAVAGLVIMVVLVAIALSPERRGDRLASWSPRADRDAPS
jgi:hypothetical protein